MANSEIQEVKELDEEWYRENIEKMIFYYGPTDAWAPFSYYLKMKSRFSDAQIHLCTDKISHAFVLSPSEVNILAKKVSSWIK